MKTREVLLVEDNPGDALLIKQVLKNFPIHLHHAQDGMEALLLLANRVKPDLVILDWNVPNISGSGVLERYHPDDVPVVVFSGSLNAADKQKSLQLGAQEFVQKPLRLQAFKDAVSKIADKWVGHANSAV